MDKPYQPPCILRLEGIALGDYRPIEDVADAKFLEDDDDLGDRDVHEPRAAPPVIFDKIPTSFTRLEDWPESTNLQCWECGFTFDGRPWFLPTYLRQNDDGSNEFGVRGNFCTANDVVLFANSTIHAEDERWRALDLLSHVYFVFTGERAALIKPSEPRHELRSFGGGLEPAEFWRRTRALDPKHGLRDHTPGSVRSERARALPDAAAHPEK